MRAAFVFALFSAIPGLALAQTGASGAIAGVMGGYFVLYPRSRVLTLIPLIVFWEIIELQAIFLLLTLSVILFNLVADLLYFKLDPRVKT